jgi:hypothetical protein
MKIRIEFPPDLAKEKAEEAREWKQGEPMIWECEEYHVKENVKREGDDIIIKTPHTKVTLHKDEVKAIAKLAK